MPASSLGGNVRANPGIYDGVAQAGERVGSAVSGIGEELGSISARVKQATDTAYLIGSQTKLEAASTDFRSWAAQHPDTSTWNDELKSRMSNVKDDVQSGSGKLSTVAKIQLKTALDDWQLRTNAGVGQMQTEQTIKNAQGIASEGVNAAIAGNNPAGADNIIKTAVSQGVWHPSYGAALSKRVRVGVATNQANADAEIDPFEAAKKLDEKNEDGSFKNYSDLPPSARLTMQFRVAKAQNETRQATMRSWAQAVSDAQQSGTPMPDKDTMTDEATRQGISAKWMTKLFQPPAAFDEGEYAKASNELSNLDLIHDPDGKNAAHAVALVTQFKGYAATQLEKLVKDRSDPGSPVNAPVFKDAMKLNEFNFSHGVYGKFETTTQDSATQKPITVVNQSALRAAQLTQAKVTDSLMGFIQQNPNASHEEVTKFMSSIYRAQANKSGAALFKFNP